jgi:hypothetical protein
MASAVAVLRDNFLMNPERQESIWRRAASGSLAETGVKRSLAPRDMAYRRAGSSMSESLFVQTCPVVGSTKRKETRETTEAGSSAECGEFVEAGKPQLGVVVHTRTQSSLSAERDKGGYLENILKVRRQRESKSGGREKGFEGD